jgi:hypothetical protein
MLLIITQHLGFSSATCITLQPFHCNTAQTHLVSLPQFASPYNNFDYSKGEPEGKQRLGYS